MIKRSKSSSDSQVILFNHYSYLGTVSQLMTTGTTVETHRLGPTIYDTLMIN